jgi:H+-transporting ATPase
MMYLMLSVAGHLTIFQTRTRGPWWSTRPAKILLIAVFGTQAFATLIAVYGAWIVTPLGWEMASLVWGYAIVWFLITDPVKLLAYRVLDHFDAKDAPAMERAPLADAHSLTKDTSPAGSVRADAPTKPVSAAASVPKGDAKATAVLVASQKPQETASGPPSAPGAKPDAVPAVAGQAAILTNVAALLDQKLGDVLLAGILKNPTEAGHLITDAIAEAEAPPTAKPAEAKATEPASSPPKAAE